MVNSWLLLSGIGMMIVGILFPVYWWKVKKVRIKYFSYGAILWIIAIAPKVILDIFISPSLNGYLIAYGTEILAIISGLYVGLRTGLLESGLTFIAGIKTNLRNLDYKKAVAFGLGFGGFEAFAAGVMGFINILVYLMNPNLIDIIPAQQQTILLQQLNQSTLVVPAAILERIFIIFIHIFCTLLVFYSIRIIQKKYLIYSIGYKTAVDGIIPALQIYIGTQTIASTYLTELPFIGFGLLAIVGIKWMKKKWSNKKDA